MTETERAPSRTADAIAWLHAAHQFIDAEPRVLDDPVIARLMGATRANIAEREERFQSAEARHLRAHAVTRTRFAEDRLAAGAARGVRQYVLLGAGMDTFAYRQPVWARDLRIFELDRSATQGIKQQRLAEARIEPPRNLTYVAADLQAELLTLALRRGGVQADQPAVFAWLGVTMYLSLPSIDAVLRTVAAFPATSEIVFTFAQPASPDDVRHGPSLAERAAAAGEPWVTYFAPPALEARLRETGFSVVDFLTPAEIVARYLHNRTDGLPPPRRTSIVSAIVDRRSGGRFE
jgi:methyltransferase (TIGR00027 family)